MRIVKSDRERACPECGTLATLRRCCVCAVAATLIDCGHYEQPRPIAAGRSDGSDQQHDYCAECGAIDA